MMQFEAQLIVCLRLGQINPILAPHLDEVLLWSSTIGTDKASPALQKILQEIGEPALQKRFERFIDALYIDHPLGYANLFDTKLPAKVAKLRYRKLISLFHPDRGHNDQEWLNRRAERVNAAYSLYKKGDIVPTRSAMEGQRYTKASGAFATNKRAAKKTSVWSALYQTFFRRYSGEHQRIHKLIVVALLVIFSIILLLGYLSTLNFQSNSTKLALSEAPVKSVLIGGNEGGVQPDPNDNDLVLAYGMIGPESVGDKELLEGFAGVSSLRQGEERTVQLQSRVGVAKTGKLIAVDRIDGVDKAALQTAAQSPAKVDSQSIELHRFADRVVEQQNFAENDGVVSQLNNDEANDVELGVEPDVMKQTVEQDGFASSVEVKRLLNQFRRYWVLGDVERLAALYTVSAEDNGLLGRLKIARHYQQVFDSTISRSAAATTLLIAQQEDAVLVEGVFTKSLREIGKELSITQKKRFRLTLVRQQTTLMIAKFEWF